jgi:hypothetical protein
MGMTQQQSIHPSVEQFKQFVRQHPKMAEEIKSNKKTLQQFFEEWSVLGPEHEQWRAYQIDIANGPNTATDHHHTAEGAHTAKNTDSTATDTLGQVMNMMRRFNVQDLQNHLAQFSSVLSNVQNVMQTFQQPNNPQTRSNQDHPFSFRRD